MSDAKNFVVCIRNDGYEESLEMRKIYERLPDPEAEQDGLIRVVDEDEDYLYPAGWFLSIELPHEIEEAFVATGHA
jgi:hypothetical protein